MTRTSNQRARAWCFTKFCKTDELLKSGEELMKTIGEGTASYLIYGIEKTKTDKTHLQGYVYFKNARSFQSVKKLLGDEVHIEKSRGTPQENIAYCSKDGKFFFFGDEPQGGRRNDITEIKSSLKDGLNMREILDVATSNQAVQFAQRWLTYKEKKRTLAPEIWWLHGPTGSGKSRRASTWAHNPHYQHGGGKWWDGYDGHDEVIINDFRQDFAAYDELLRLFDRYPHRVQVKGGYRSWLATKIYITAPKTPQEMFLSAPKEGEEILRRINHVWYIPKRDWEEILSGHMIHDQQWINKKIEEIKCDKPE